jgi:hypothetical protein
LVEMSPESEIIDDHFLGEGYAKFTPEGMNAIRRFQELENIGLEGTYSGKSAAALIAHGERGELEGRVVLFWHTYNSNPIQIESEQMDYKQLPRGFHRYFEGEVQPLDRESG